MLRPTLQFTQPKTGFTSRQPPNTRRTPTIRQRLPATHAMNTSRPSACPQFATHSRLQTLCSATPAQRHAKAAAKYSTGPQQLSMFTRPTSFLTSVDVENFNVKEQLAQFTVAAATNPQLYAHKLADERTKQLEDQQQERVAWDQIL